jgi:hypothetical protein
MPITRPAPERSFKVCGTWTVNELENDHGYEFVTPLGYVLGFASKEDVLSVLPELVGDGMIHLTMYGDIHRVEMFHLRAWKPDPWINKETVHNEWVCRTSDLARVIVEYIKQRWIS